MIGHVIKIHHISNMNPTNFDKMVKNLVRDWFMGVMQVSQPSQEEKKRGG